MSDALPEREKKLLLVRQVRSRYSEDQYDLSNREQLLYGRTSIPDRSVYSTASPYSETACSYGETYGEDGAPSPEGEALASFKLRLVLAALLFGLVVFLDKSDTAIGGITAQKLYTAISADYEDKLEDWAEAISGSVQR